MRKFCYFFLVIFSGDVLSNNAQGMIEAYVHVKCVSATTETLVVLENKTPYKLFVNDNRALTDENFNPSNLILWDMEKYIAAYSNSGNNIMGMSFSLDNRNFNIRAGKLHFEPFEKKYWIVKGVERYFKFDSDKLYAFSLTGLTLDFIHEDKHVETVVFSSNMALIPESCSKAGR